MNPLTLRNRVLIHLNGYNHIEHCIRFGAPYEITQDGVGMELGISRSYASLILGRMEQNGIVETGLSTIRGSGSKLKRKIYFLTVKGRMEHDRMVKSLLDDGYSEEELRPRPNINHCSSDAFDDLGEEDRDTIGSLCVLRCDIHRDEIPDGIPMIQYDVRGYVRIREDARDRVLSRADDRSLRRWHSGAADWWVGRGNEHERLYHLVNAGRYHEAVTLVNSGFFDIVETGDTDMSVTLDTLSGNCADEWVHIAAAMVDIRHGRFESAHTVLDRFDGPVNDALRAELMAGEGFPDEAVELSLKTYRGDRVSGFSLGKSMLMAGRYEEALVFLGRTRELMVAERCTFRLDEVLEMESEASVGLGFDERARALAELASCITRDEVRREGLGRTVSGTGPL
ncbi:MAG: hypothetical protein IJ026_07250 [Candidatus Methanomethylophilaceae archaeon]|nr:hypothetical protein [Candidatus Methanomethylophilaceae archaeon]